MAYQVIARKWRPQNFEEVIGQDATTRTLKNAIKYDRLHHGYIFSGARGVGKTTTARLFAKALNCRLSDSPNPRPCNSEDESACDSCSEITESRSLDVIEFDAASHTRVDDIRDIILENINVVPARDRYKIFIIDEVHMLSRNSFNALLKTLEEPPQNVVFIMATTELHKVPDTVLSRCQQFSFRTIPIKKIFSRLDVIAKAEEIDISENALREIARSGAGSMRDAQSNFDQVISYSDGKIESTDVIDALGITSSENLEQTIRAIIEKDSAAILLVVEDLVERGQDLRNFCQDLLSVIRDLMVVKILAEPDDLLETAILNREVLVNLSEQFSEPDLTRFFNSLAETETKLRNSSEPRYLLEIGLIKLIEIGKLISVESLVKRITDLERSGAQTSGENIEEPKVISGESKKKTRASSSSKKSTLESADPSLIAQLKKQRSSSQLPSSVSLDEDHVSTEEPQSGAPRNEQVESDTPQNEDVQEASSMQSRASGIDPDKMPVRLEPIPAEDLEHIEDTLLDRDFENRLQMEGDSLETLTTPTNILTQLDLAHPDHEKPQNGISPRADASGNRGTRAQKIAQGFAAEVEEPSVEIPILPENPTKEDLMQFAENHPLVRRVNRVFRGTLTRVKKT